MTEAVAEETDVIETETETDVRPLQTEVDCAGNYAVVLTDGTVKVLLTGTEATSDRLAAAAADLFCGVAVLLWRLSQHLELAVALDADPNAVAAGALLTKSLMEVKGQPFDPADFR
jgi:hypothetical protein